MESQMFAVKIYDMKTIYERPALTSYDIQLDGFICSSLDKVTLTMEVDQHVDYNEEDLSN